MSAAVKSRRYSSLRRRALIAAKDIGDQVNGIVDACASGDNEDIRRALYYLAFHSAFLLAEELGSEPAHWRKFVVESLERCYGEIDTDRLGHLAKWRAKEADQFLVAAEAVSKANGGRSVTAAEMAAYLDEARSCS